MKILTLVFLTLAFSARLLAQPFSPLLDTDTRDLLHEALSGELAKEYVIDISRFHRIQGSRGYRSAAEYVVDQLIQFGFTDADAYIESFPSDGKVHYQTWQSPSGWDIDFGELRMVEPVDERIVGYPEIAMSVMTYSNPGDVTAELVWVGSGTRDEDYENKDVNDKIVLATGYGGDVHRLAVLKYGAAAVVCYLDDSRAKDYPDMLAYTGMWPRTEELDRVRFGFNLTNRQGERLRDMLLAGRRVVLKATVSGIGLEPFFMDIPVAHIRGAEFPEEALVFCAHLDHPKESANDNASGSAALIDIARALKDLIDSGRLPRPKRSIRFVWVPEWYGSMAYIDAHPEMVGPALGGTFLANINMDMAGEHLEILHSRMTMTSTPASLPSVLNDVVENMAGMVDGMNIRTPRGSRSAFNYRMGGYGGGSDHMMFIDRKIPGIMISHGPDDTHHTSEDTPDKVDPVELERAEIIGTAAFWYLANLDESGAIDLVHLAGANAAGRLGNATRQAVRWITQSEDLATTWFEAQNLLEVEAANVKAAIASVLYFHESPAIRQQVSTKQTQIDQQLASSTAQLATMIQSKAGSIKQQKPYQNEDKRVPIRLTRGPLDFGLPESNLAPEAASWYRSDGRALYGTIRFELVKFVDGQRNITEIRNLISAEFSPIDQEIIARYISDLVRIGVAAWK